MQLCLRAALALIPDWGLYREWGGGGFDVVVARGFQSQEIVTELQSEF